MKALLPGSTIGMLGGGQLARMFILAAKQMDYHVWVLDPDEHCPASKLADAHLCADFSDWDALEEMAAVCDVFTTEFENIPADSLEYLASFKPVRPCAKALKITQSRSAEKSFVQQCGLKVAPYVFVQSINDLFDVNIQFPAILKLNRLGYDGKGQRTIHSLEEAQQSFEAFQHKPCVLEQRINLACELSVIVARNEKGEMNCFPVAENIHQQGILHQTIVPARIDQEIQQSASDAAQKIAEHLKFIGVMAVEFFYTQEGQLLVNEMAPRTHNSGHFSIDACITSQFEQQLRMVCNLPFGSTELLSPVVMMNLLGDVWRDGQSPDWVKVLQQKSLRLHLYGKQEARAGRKMGHFCVLDGVNNTALQKAEEAYASLLSQA